MNIIFIVYFPIQVANFFIITWIQMPGNSGLEVLNTHDKEGCMVTMVSFVIIKSGHLFLDEK